VARLGGDEFAILLPGADRAAAELVADDIVSLIRGQVCFLDGTRPRVTTSIGVVLINDPTMTASELVSTADMTMYDAKDSGRDRYVLLDV
jgi:diguanylate cyclase (GGDEF)-like protein